MDLFLLQGRALPSKSQSLPWPGCWGSLRCLHSPTTPSCCHRAGETLGSLSGIPSSPGYADVWQNHGTHGSRGSQSLTRVPEVQACSSPDRWSHPGVSDSLGLGRKFAFLRSSQVMRRLLVWGHTEKLLHPRYS